MAKAARASLEELHAAIAKVLKKEVESEGVSASTLAVAVRFLKDNGIEAGPGNPELDDLAKTLEEDLPFTTNAH